MMRNNLQIKLTFLFLLSSFAAYSQNSQNTISLNIILGYPDSAGYIIERPQYVISYSDKLNSARWVSWHIDKSYYGSVKRYSGNFITDTILPKNYAIIKHSDYTNSGYDRGHLVRSEERTKTKEDNKSTFYLTNVIPQVPDLNRKIWLQLENYCKKLCREGNKKLYVVAGGKYSENPQLIKSKIAIPDSCWKVVLILDSGKTINDIDTSTQIIAVMMPNNSKIKQSKNWYEFLRTAREIEQSTGFNFFSIVPIEIQNVIENRKYKNAII